MWHIVFCRMRMLCYFHYAMKAILRKIDTGHDHSFSLREDIAPYLYNHWHFHPEVELTLIRKGTGMRLVGDSMEPFGDGDLVLLGENLPHLWRSDRRYFEGAEGVHTEAVAIHFREDFWGSAFLELPELAGLRDLLHTARRGLRIEGVTRTRLSSMMEESLTAAGVRRITILIDMLNLVGDSGEYSVLSGAGFSKSYDPLHTDSINIIYSYTLDHFSEEITIGEVARVANISPNSFCRFFKSRTLKTYWEFLVGVRIGYACKLLIESERSISEICYSCGFNNLSNFNRRFKHTTGMAPSAYRKAHSHTLRAF